MSSCILFHGPSARETVLDVAHHTGRLLDDPLGDGGLRVGDARKVVGLLQSIPVGSKKGIVVIGPMDLASNDASDVLLKCIEEFDGRYVQPLLWANDLGGVTPTVRSRCLDRWCPQTEEFLDDDDLVATGYDLVHASREREFWNIPILVSKYLKTHKGGEHDILRSAVDALAPDLDDERNRLLWTRIRKVAMHRNPTTIEIITVFLPSLEDLA